MQQDRINRARARAAELVPVQQMDEQYRSFLVMGNEGTGKTRLGTTYTRGPVLHILLEQNGMETLRRFTRGRDDYTVYPVRDADDLDDVMELALTGYFRDEMGIRLIVVDGVTQAQRLYKEGISDHRLEVTLSKRLKGSGDADDVEVEEVFTKRDWGTLGDRTLRFTNRLRALSEMHDVLATAIAKVKTGSSVRGPTGKRQAENGPTVEIVPHVEGGSGTAYGQFFTAVGYAFRDASGGYAVLFSGDGRFRTKTVDGLPVRAKPDMDLWLQALDAQEGERVDVEADPEDYDDEETHPESDTNQGGDE